jgi:hypothetical protein
MMASKIHTPQSTPHAPAIHVGTYPVLLPTLPASHLKKNAKYARTIPRKI